MATEFKLIPDPTFTAPVTLTRPGQSAVQVQFTFKHLGEEERFDIDDAADARLQTLRAEHDMPEDIEAAIAAGTLDVAAYKRYARALRAVRLMRLLPLLAGWELSDEFTEANLRKLLSYYPAAYDAILATYRAEVDGARTKN